jgi:hypothetical protein
VLLVHYTKWVAAFYFTGLAYYFEAVGRSGAAFAAIALTAVSLYLFLARTPEAIRTRR